MQPASSAERSAGPVLAELERSLGGVIFGQQALISDLLTALLARGHVLLEGVPGVAKTLAARSLAQALSLQFNRVQFTPDLMPSDLLGTHVFRPQQGTFELLRGPLFTELLVADEINRTPPKTQAALLEAMEERQISLEGQTHRLDPGFFVVATQNPLELEGTYPLPEAQLDRFLMRIRVGYPAETEELSAVRAFHERKGAQPSIAPVVGREALRALQAQAGAVLCDDSVLAYAVRVTRQTRQDARVRLGASPRAAQALVAAAKARAVLHGRDFAMPDDVKEVSQSVLNHRLILTPEAEVEGVSTSEVIARTLEQVQVPR
jgi:MoxR-like ATPase